MGEKREEIQSERERETHREPAGVGGRRKAGDRVERRRRRRRQQRRIGGRWEAL